MTDNGFKKGNTLGGKYNPVNKYTCICGKKFRLAHSLWEHKRKCFEVKRTKPVNKK